MTGKDLKRMMRKHGVSVKMLAAYLQTTETGVRKMQKEDSDYYYFSDAKYVENTVRSAHRLPGAYCAR